MLISAADFSDCEEQTFSNWIFGFLLFCSKIKGMMFFVNVDLFTVLVLGSCFLPVINFQRFLFWLNTRLYGLINSSYFCNCVVLNGVWLFIVAKQAPSLIVKVMHMWSVLCSSTSWITTSYISLFTQMILLNIGIH